MQIAGVDIGLGIEGDQVLGNRPRFVEVIRILQLNLVVIGAESRGNVDREDIAEARKPERGRIGDEARIDKDLGARILEEEVNLFDRLGFVAVVVVYPAGAG